MNSESICPYPGLRPFSEDESLYFKGRDEHGDKLIELLQVNKFLMLTGASGDGKSSMVFAGLVPKILSGFFKSQFNQWVIADFRPEKKPLHNLASCVSEPLKLDSVEAVLSELKMGFSSLINLYKNSTYFPYKQLNTPGNFTPEETKSATKKAANFLLIVDQFEEFFTNPENYYKGTVSGESKIVINLLLETVRIAKAENIPVYIVCTMRSDYIGNCAAFRGLPEAIGESHYFIPRLNRKEIEQAISEPAILSGNSISHRLVERLLEDLKEGTDILPVLQHALYRIWMLQDESGSKEMDLIHYAKAGGMRPDELPTENRAEYEKWYSGLPSYKKTLLSNPGLENILNIHAGELYETAYLYFKENYKKENGKTEISQEKVKNIIRTVFSCLTKIDDNRAIRHRMTVQEIAEILNDPETDIKIISGLLNLFRESGNTLIYPFKGGRTIEIGTEKPLLPDSVLDITHEALIRNWNHLREWTYEENESAEIFADLNLQLNHWLRNGKSKDYLLSLGSYSYFHQWFLNKKPSRAWIERYMEHPAMVPESEMQKMSVSPESMPASSDPIFLKNIEKKQRIENSKVLLENLHLFFTKNKAQLDLKRKLAVTALITITILFLTSLVAFFKVRHEKNISRSNEIAMKSFMQSKEDPTLAFNLAEQAYKIYPGDLAMQALNQVYHEGPFYHTIMYPGGIVNDAVYSLDGNFIVICLENSIKIFEKNGNMKKEIIVNADAVTKLTVSTDGKFFASASSDKFIRLWDFEGKEIKKLEGHTGKVTNIGFLNDTINLFSLSTDSAVIFWDLKENKKQVFKKKGVSILGIRLSKVSGNIALACSDASIRILNHNLSEIYKITSPHTVISDFTFSPDGKYILISLVDNTAYLLNLKGDILLTLGPHQGKLKYGRFSLDQRRIITFTSEGLIYFWDLNGNPINTIQGANSPFTSISFSPDGKSLLTSSNENVMHSFDLDGNERSIYRGHFGPVVKCIFSQDGNSILSISLEQTIRIWDSKSIKKPIMKGHNDFIWDMNYSKNGNFIGTSSDDKTAGIWDANGNELRTLIGHTNKVRLIEFSRDDQYILTESEDNTAILWDLSGKVMFSINGVSSYFNYSSFSPDNQVILVPLTNYTMKLYGITGMEKCTFLGHTSTIWNICFSPDSKWVLSGSSDNTARLWSIKGNHARILSGHKDRIYKVDFSPDNIHFATASYDHTGRIWSINDSSYIELKGHSAILMYTEFSPDGKLITTSSNDKTAKLWDLTGNCLATLTGHTEMVNTCMFSPDGKFLLTSSDDGTARVWDLKGKCLNVLKGHTKSVQKAVWSPDGKHIATCSQDATARIWRPFIEDLLHEIKDENVRGRVWQMGKEDLKKYGIE